MPTSSVSARVGNISCVIPDGDLRVYLLQAGITKINYFENRPGSEFGSGKVLLTKSDLESLTADRIDLSFLSENDPGDNVEVKYTDLLIQESSMLMTPVETDNSLFIVTLVDRRFYSDRDFIGTDLTFFPETSCNEDPSQTWESILNEYWELTHLEATPLDHSEAEYPTILMKDVNYLKPTSSLMIITDVLKMIGHGLFVDDDGTGPTYKVLPLKFVSATNSTTLTAADFNDRIIQRKTNTFIARTFVPNSLDIFFRPENSSQGDIRFSYPNPNSPRGTFRRAITLFNCVTDLAEMQSFSDQISSLIFDGYATAHQVDSVLFGLIKVDHTPRCAYVEHYHDLISNSFKTKIRSHQRATSPRPPSVKQDNDKLVRFILTEDMEICGTAEAILFNECCEPQSVVALIDTTGQAHLEDESRCLAGFAGWAKPFFNPETSEYDSYEVVSFGRENCCDGVTEQSSEESESEESENSEESGDSNDSDELCITIPGVNFEDLPKVLVQEGDYVLIVRDGCLMLGGSIDCPRRDESE